MVTKITELYRQRQEGAIGYILLWLMGVPASILFLIFLLRGCNEDTPRLRPLPRGSTPSASSCSAGRGRSSCSWRIH